MLFILETVRKKASAPDGLLGTDDIAQRLGIHRGYATLLMNGFEPRAKVGKSNFFDEEQVRQLEEFRAERKRQKPNLERTEALVRQYASGMTLEDCGNAHGITRERARQLLVRAGISRKDGGPYILRSGSYHADLAKEKLRRIEARARKTYFCSEAERVQVKLSSPVPFSALITRYKELKRNSKTGGINFALSLPDYAALVLPIWSQLGRGTGRLCCGTKDVMLGYVPGNVEIRSNEDNGRRKSHHDRGPITLLQSMRFGMRQIVGLYNSGKPIEEIARMLRTTKANVHVHLSSARRMNAIAASALSVPVAARVK